MNVGFEYMNFLWMIRINLIFDAAPKEKVDFFYTIFK